MGVYLSHLLGLTVICQSLHVRGVLTAFGQLSPLCAPNISGLEPTAYHRVQEIPSEMVVVT